MASSTAANMRTIRRHVSWIDYCIKAAEELKGPHELYNSGYGVFDDIVDSYRDDNAKLFSSIEDSPGFNFL